MNRKIQGAALALLALAAAAGTPAAEESPVRVAEVLCDGRHDPVGVDPGGVRFSWVMESDARGQSQGAYRIEVASSREALLAGRADVWASGRVGGRESLLVPYAGPPLAPAHVYFWRVRVEDAAGRLTDWSAPGRFVTALSEAADWGEARWIGYEDMPERERLVPGVHGLLDPKVHPKLKRPVVPLLRRVFTVRQPVAQALLFVSGLGHYEAYLNGAKVGDRFLAPGWTDYRKTVLYDAYDVTAQAATRARTRSRPSSATASTTSPRSGTTSSRSPTAGPGFSPPCASSTRTAAARRSRRAPPGRRRRRRSPSPASTGARTSTRGSSRRAGRGPTSTTRAGAGRPPPPRRPAACRSRPITRCA